MLSTTTLLTQASISSPQDVQIVVEGLAQRAHLETRSRAGEIAFAEMGLTEGEVDKDTAWSAQYPAGWQHSHVLHTAL